jgi:hypothetical protein
LTPTGQPPGTRARPIRRRVELRADAAMKITICLMQCDFNGSAGAVPAKLARLAKSETCPRCL